MSLTTALNIAKQSLQATSRQTAVVSQNVTNAGNSDYVRRNAVISSEAPGARVVVIQRAANEALFRANLSAVSSYEGQGTLRSSIDTLAQAVNGVDNANSPAKALGSLYEAIQLYSNNPANASLGESAIEAARQVVRSLNDGTAAVNAQRTNADMLISVAVDELNGLLKDFESANSAIVAGTQTGRDVSDQLDRRDSILKQIAQYVPVSTITRENNDMVLTTASGAILFETSPRTVTFQPKPGYDATTVGNSVYIDGVPLQAGSGGDTDASGRIAAYLQLRDTVAPNVQAQLDEVARGLVMAFAETDQTGGAAPDLAGLFTWSGGPALPATGVVSPGLAGSLSVNAAMDSRQGGNPTVLRDGGANGAVYVGNTGGNASYADLLIEYSANLDVSTTFDPAAGAGTNASVLDYSSDIISWLENLRQQATKAEENKQALVVRTAEALSNDTGVNMDQELSLLLELEHSYDASARLIKAVDEMLANLIAMVR
nr:flagellar hook-associated protein FlgK [Mesorhizobium sp.]